MTYYTLGFLFNQNLSQVLLIHKLSPEWQKGQINGLGGKFEAGESAQECITREVSEETSLITQPNDWQKMGELQSAQFQVEVLTMVYEGAETAAKSLEAQQVEWFSVDNLPKNCMSNLTWLIPLCKDGLETKKIKNFAANY